MTDMLEQIRQLKKACTDIGEQIGQPKKAGIEKR
jgi:hypothetical protein